MKRSKVSFSGISRFVGLAVVLAGGVAQADPISPTLPNGLRRGVNIAYVYGNLTHRFHISTATGMSALSVPRMREMLRNDEDFQDFKQLVEDGFGHVRIPIDPVALGLFESTPIPDIVPGNAAIFQPIYEDILDAQEAGLLVILDFHPLVISEKSYAKKWGENVHVPPAGHEYPGRYLYHYLDGVGSPNHPLAKVWQTFTTGLDAYFASQHKDPPTDTVVMEILNEPFEQLSYHGETGLANHLPSHLTADNPVTSTVEDTHTGWMIQQMREFRNIAKFAAQAVHAVNPNYRIIIGQHLQLASAPENTNLLPAHKAPYTTADFPNLGKIIYAWHLYEPMTFTHVDGVNFPDYSFARDFTGTVPGTTYNCHYWIPGFEPAKVANDAIYNWSQNHKAQLGFFPQIVFTEFGAQHRGGSAHDAANNDDGDPGGNPPPPLERALMRTQWYFDTRTYIEKLDNTGWSAYEYLGDMALYRGTNTNPASMYQPNNYNLHGYRGVLKQNIRQALFGSSRPTQAD